MGKKSARFGDASNWYPASTKDGSHQNTLGVGRVSRSQMEEKILEPCDPVLWEEICQAFVDCLIHVTSPFKSPTGRTLMGNGKCEHCSRVKLANGETTVDNRSVKQGSSGGGGTC